MKKLFALILTALFAITVSSQNNILFNSINGLNPASFPAKPFSVQSMNTFYIDYDSAEAATYGTQYKRMMYHMNKYYTAADSAPNHFIVSFDSLYDVYADTAYAQDSVTSLGIDSLFLFLGHENNSGADDTLVVRIVSTNANGYPDGTTQHWWTVIVIPSGTPLSGQWTQPVMIPIFPNIIINDNSFAVQVEYWGNPSDTLGFVAGYGDLDSCGNLPTSAALTQFSPYNITANNTHSANSFVQYSHFTNFGILPTPSGSHVYYNCDTITNYTAGIDGESFIQNISLVAKVTTNDVLSVNETKDNLVSVSQNFPNPFSNITTINYKLSANADVVFTVFDITGKQIFSFSEGNKTAGKHSAEINADTLESGIYFFTISANGISQTGKMTVIK